MEPSEASWTTVRIRTNLYKLLGDMAERDRRSRPETLAIILEQEAAKRGMDVPVDEDADGKAS